LDFLGEVGGLIDLLRLLFGIMLSQFSDRRILAILTNRLYHISSESKQIIADLHAKLGSSNKLRVRPSGDVELSVPMFLDLEHLFYYIFCCCNGVHKAYVKALDLGEENLLKEMDVVRYVKRSRMHGIGLNFLLNNKLRKISARIAFSKPLNHESNCEGEDPTDMHSIGNLWLHINH